MVHNLSHAGLGAEDISNLYKYKIGLSCSFDFLFEYRKNIFCNSTVLFL